MVQEYEDNVIPLPLQFKDGWKTTPTPRKVKSVVPAAVKRTNIEEKIKALKGYVVTYDMWSCFLCVKMFSKSLL